MLIYLWYRRDAQLSVGWHKPYWFPFVTLESWKYSYKWLCRIYFWWFMQQRYFCPGLCLNYDCIHLIFNLVFSEAQQRFGRRGRIITSQKATPAIYIWGWCYHQRPGANLLFLWKLLGWYLQLTLTWTAIFSTPELIILLWIIYPCTIGRGAIFWSLQPESGDW